MAKTLNLAAVFREDAEGLRGAREKAMRIHPTDIRAAGNEVEEAVREYLSRMLQPRYHVTSGHLIDSESRVSPQIDIIIADNFGLPSLLTTKDGTEYVPVDSVYAIGEVKSTYYESKKYYSKMAEDLRQVAEMNRPLIKNTAFDGIKDNTTLAHMILPLTNKYLNHLYSFLLCVDTGGFSIRGHQGVAHIRTTQVSPQHCCLLEFGSSHVRENYRAGRNNSFQVSWRRLFRRTTTGVSLRGSPLKAGLWRELT